LRGRKCYYFLRYSARFLRKPKEANGLIFGLCALDVAKAREDAAQKLIDAVGMQYDILRDKRASKT